MANHQTMQGNWNEIVGKIRSRWAEFTQDELQQYRGNTDQLIGFLQRKTGESREKLEGFLDDSLAKGSGAMGSAAESAREYAHQAMDSLGDNYRSARASAADMADRLRGGYSSAAEMVQERPGSSVAVAFGAGLVAGVVVALMLRGGHR